MRKTLGWILFIVGLIVLGWWGKNHQAEDIQAEITSEADALTQNVDASVPDTSVTATVSGRDINLTGTIPENQIDNVLGQYEDLKGRRVVRNDLTTIPTAAPYTFQINKSKEGKVDVMGYANTSSAVDQLMGDFSSADSVSVELAAGAPENWVQSVETASSALDKLDYGTASISDTNVTIDGYASSNESKAAAETQLASLGAPYTSTSNISAPAIGPNFEVDFDITQGLAITGSSTEDGTDKYIADTLNAPIVSSRLNNDNEGDLSGVSGRLTAIAEYLPFFDTAEVQVKDDVVNFHGVAATGVMPADQRDAFLTNFNADDQVVIEDANPEANAKRTNILNGQNEYYAAGYWLPEMSFDVNLANCQTQTDEIMNGQTINFVVGSANLDASSNAIINRLSALMNACLSAGNLGLEIGGHTDSDGDAAANEALSQARADAVKSAIATRGVDVANVVAVGYGEALPIADNNTAEGKKANRRTTFKWADLAALENAEAEAAEAAATEADAETGTSN